MPDKKARVHPDTALQASEPVAEGAPIPLESCLKALERHALHRCKHAGDIVDLLGPHGRDRKTAIPSDNGCYAVQRGRTDHRIPENLRVVVRVDVDKAGRDNEAGYIDDGARRLLLRSYAGDDPVPHPD